MVRSNRIAIIPARGGSKRIPRKNIIDFAGKPIIAWTIEAALDTGLFDRVLVSTDDEEIASVSRSFGADVPFLRDRHNDDFSSASLATIAALDQVERLLKERYEVVAQLMANCPLRGSEHIESAIRLFETSGSDFQVSCSKYGWLNPRWAHEIDENNVAKSIFPEWHMARSQDLPNLYCPTGAIWIAKVKSLNASGTFYGPGYRFAPLDWKTGVDIDDDDDMKMAMLIFRLKEEKGPC